MLRQVLQQVVIVIINLQTLCAGIALTVCLAILRDLNFVLRAGQAQN